VRLELGSRFGLRRSLGLGCGLWLVTLCHGERLGSQNYSQLGCLLLPIFLLPVVDATQDLFKKRGVAGHGVSRAYCDDKPKLEVGVEGNSVGQWRGVRR
jgi:hypothetical protein